MSDRDTFPQPGEKRSHYCKSCQKIVEWEIVEKDGEYYWYSAECDRAIKIGKWPDEDLPDSEPKK